MITVIVQYDQIDTFRAGLNPLDPCVGIDVDPTGLTFEDRNLIADRLHSTEAERSSSLSHYLCCGVLQDGVTKPLLHQQGGEADPVFLPVVLPNLESVLEAVRADAAKLRLPAPPFDPAAVKLPQVRPLDDSADADQEFEADALVDAPMGRMPTMPRLGAKV
jgi:hypothetical protein